MFVALALALAQTRHLLPAMRSVRVAQSVVLRKNGERRSRRVELTD